MLLSMLLHERCPMAKFATVRDLKNQTTALIREAEKGKAVVVTRRGKPVSMDAALSSFTLLEICGAASFRLSTEELEAWLFAFTSLYPVCILDVHGLRGNDCEAWWSTFVEEAAANIAKKMTFGDAVLL